MDKTSNSQQIPPLQQTAVKCRFFAQYWGTKTMYVGGVGLVEIGTGGWNLKHPDFFLELKPTKRLTDNEAIELGKILNIKDDEVIGILISDEFLNTMTNVKNGGVINLHAIDYLRSKGYAIPFMEYSVDKLVELGWVRLV
jgi:hypothetical protein